jgi:hypothetical protein
MVTVTAKHSRHCYKDNLVLATRWKIVDTETFFSASHSFFNSPISAKPAGKS